MTRFYLLKILELEKLWLRIINFIYGDTQLTRSTYRFCPYDCLEDIGPTIRSLCRTTGYTLSSWLWSRENERQNSGYLGLKVDGVSYHRITFASTCNCFSQINVGGWRIKSWFCLHLRFFSLHWLSKKSIPDQTIKRGDSVINRCFKKLLNGDNII